MRSWSQRKLPGFREKPEVDKETDKKVTLNETFATKI